ncbi:MAG: VaFE repeat-containing surface-anchored protein [Eubacterium sp.]|nr:VaFE repeat-containing surface-anchored protein [Eubacterium sp.]
MKKKRIIREISTLFLVMVMMVSSLSGVTLAATGDNVIITFEPCYDKNGSVMKYNAGETINGHYAGGKGENINRIFADGEAAFCIQPGVGLHTGSQLKESSSDTWKVLSANKKKAVGLALLYGYSGNKKNLKGSDDEKWTATQVLVWEFVTGCRKATGAYKRSEKTIYSLYFGSSYANAGAKEVYDQIVDLLKEHNTIPSFMSENKTEILKDMKLKDGKYAVTLTDENNVLSDFDFSCGNDKIKITKSGNKLTISSVEALEKSVRIKAVKNTVPTVGNSAKLLAYGSDQLQDVVSGAENAEKVISYVNVQTKTGNLLLKKTSEDGIVSGISFTVQGEDYERTVKTGSDGSISIEDMIPGTYTITENVSDRYVPLKSQTVTVVGGKTTTVQFSNILKKFNVTVKKKDAEKVKQQGNATLSNAVYGIYKNGVLIDRYTTDGKGEFTTKYYACGDGWTVREISPSEGYLLDKTSYPVGAEPKLYPIEYNNIKKEVNEQVEKGKIAVIKHTDDGKTQIETPESGAEFEVYLKSAGSYDRAEGTERDRLVCDKNGFAQTKDMPYGTYTVHQTKGWEGREFIDDFDVFIQENGETYRYIINNRDFESHIKIVKKDEETGKVIPCAGTGFQIYDPKGKLVKMKFMYPKVITIDTFYTTEDGTLITPEPLPSGKGYSIVEVKAPYGYVLNVEPVFFDVIQNASEKEEEVAVIEVSRMNKPQKGRVVIEKSGEIFQSVSESEGVYQPIFQTSMLKGVIFQITAAEDIITPDGTVRIKKGEVADTVTTDEKGKAKSRELYLGKYKIEETTVPYGMVRLEEPHEVEISYAGEAVEITETTAEIYNERQHLQIDLMKTLEKNEAFGIGGHNEIEEVRFGLYAKEELKAGDGKVIPKDGLLEIATCDKEGKAIFKTDIPVGAELYVKEYSTEEHYQLSDLIYPVTFVYAGGEQAVVTIVVNEGKVIENYIKYGMVKGLKVDRETGKTIAKAVFGLFPKEAKEFNEKTAILTAESDKKGVFTFEKVPLGEWVIRELKPAKGYLANEEQYSVTIGENEEVVEIKVFNDRIPKIGTTATIQGKKEAVAAKTIVLKDKVSYKHLIPGKEYVLKGILMDKKTGKPFLIDGKKVQSETAFKPKRAGGKVTVTFTFNGTKITKDTDIVVFETLYCEGVELTVHADIKDQGQTVTIKLPVPEIPQTGDCSMMGFFIGIGAAALGGLISLVIVKKKKDEDEAE